MQIDLKTVAVIVSLASVLIGAAMGYGSLTTRVNSLEKTVETQGSSNTKMEADIMEIKTNIATLLERTKP